jgi:hypothetical protein
MASKLSMRDSSLFSNGPIALGLMVVTLVPPNLGRQDCWSIW